jgi:hypothetical protein
VINRQAVIPNLPQARTDFSLSAPRPPLAFTGDLQMWIRNADLDPDWLRVGTDIVDDTTPPTFNGSFSVSGTTP